MSDSVNITARNARLCSLGDVASLRAGYSFRSAIPESAEGDVLAVQLRDIRRERLNWSTVVRTSLAREPGKNEWLSAGDVLFVFRGTRYFAVVLEQVPMRTVASTQFMLVRVKDSSALLPGFLAWQLNQAPAQKYFNQAAEGTAQRSLRRAKIEAVTLAVPSVQRQRAIVELVDLARRERDAMDELMRIREQQLSQVAASLRASAGAAEV